MGTDAAVFRTHEKASQTPPNPGPATLQTITQSTVSGFKGLENVVILVVGFTDIESDWPRGLAYVGMSRARTRLHVIIIDAYSP